MQNRFSSRLSELLKENNISKRFLAQKIGVSAMSVSDWSTGNVQPTAENIYIIAQYFQVSTDYLLGRTDDFGNVSVQTATPALSEEETEILNAFRAMTYSQRIRFAAYAEGMLENTTKKKA